MNLEHLVTMANEIGTFFDSDAGDAAASSIANHLRRFWDPRMRAQLIAHLANGGEGLSPSVAEALRQLPAVVPR